MNAKSITKIAEDIQEKMTQLNTMMVNLQEMANKPDEIKNTNVSSLSPTLIKGLSTNKISQTKNGKNAKETNALSN